MKVNKKTVVLTTVVCLIPVIAGVILYPKLPEQIATHWDAHGNVNGISHKFTGAIVFPGILVLVNLMLPFLMTMDPKYENMSEKLKTVVQWIIPIVSVVCSGITLANGLGRNWPVEVIAPMLTGVIIVIIGNYLPKTKQSYTMGIKLPWTLNSEENWNKTHRVAGFVWVICGIVMMISCLLPLISWLFTGCFVLIIVIPVVYSYLYYLKEKARDEASK